MDPEPCVLNPWSQDQEHEDRGSLFWNGVHLRVLVDQSQGALKHMYAELLKDRLAQRALYSQLYWSVCDTDFSATFGLHLIYDREHMCKEIYSPKFGTLWDVSARYWLPDPEHLLPCQHPYAMCYYSYIFTDDGWNSYLKELRHWYHYIYGDFGILCSLELRPYGRGWHFLISSDCAFYDVLKLVNRIAIKHSINNDAGHYSDFHISWRRTNTYKPGERGKRNWGSHGMS